ncbi:hypothetical protein MMC11_005021 [Xylographa trunciseda]|nr:hypothetical protein [Xylographa trunciseda]
MEQQFERPLSRIPVPPYEAWPSAPKGPLESHIINEKSSAMDLENVMSPMDRHSRATSALSMDDIEAAQALEGLRADFMQSPTRSITLQPSHGESLQCSSNDPSHPEPLLSLITSQHPLLSTAINGSLSAYSSSKSYSPRFRYGAEFVERNIASPVANTVGTAGRISGVETGVRWWLQRSDSNEAHDGSNKRRRINDDHEREMDVEKGLKEVTLQPSRQRAASSISFPESLPAYDDQRSPSYEEHGPTVQLRRPQHDATSPTSRTWQTRLMMSTSGLGVAMSEESLRSLKYCLSWLRWANSHLSRVLGSLQSVLEEWDRSHRQMSSESNVLTHDNNMQLGPANGYPRDDATIAKHIQALKGECVQTLKNVVDIVSKYAGGALPENARVLVRRHLTSLPQRFMVASSAGSSANESSHDSEQQSSTPEVISGAQRVVVLAKEGLYMMAQVSEVVNGTIVSAEEWCDRLGRKREKDDQHAGHLQNGNEEKIDLVQRNVEMPTHVRDEKTDGGLNTQR